MKNLDKIKQVIGAITIILGMVFVMAMFAYTAWMIHAVNKI